MSEAAGGRARARRLPRPKAQGEGAGGILSLRVDLDEAARHTSNAILTCHTCNATLAILTMPYIHCICTFLQHTVSQGAAAYCVASGPFAGRVRRIDEE